MKRDELYQIEGAPMIKYVFSANYKDDESLFMFRAPHTYSDGVSGNKYLYFLSDEFQANPLKPAPESALTRIGKRLQNFVPIPFPPFKTPDEIKTLMTSHG